LQDRALYAGADRAAAERLFGLGGFPVVTAEVTDGPLSPGDAILAIGGKPLGPADSTKPFARIAAIEAGLEAGPAELLVRRNGGDRVLRVEAPFGCRSRVQVVPGRKLNARADGTYVQLTDAVAREAADDSELAFVIAHEMAHNILRHAETPGPKRLEEDQADRLGVKLMHAAGYDPHAAARFWSRFGKRTGLGIFSDGSHRRTKARVAFLSAEAAELTK
jgi:beta-barrel assembly-enhancing protease